MPAIDLLAPMKTDIPSVPAVQLDCASGPDPAAIGAEMHRAFGLLDEFVRHNRLAMSAPPRAIYTAWGPEGVSMTLAIPVAAPAAPVPAGGTVRLGTLPASRTLRFTHRGPYRDLMTTYGRITAYLKEEGLIEDEAGWAKYMPMWEEYAGDPDTTPEADLVTYIHLPLD